MGAHPIGAGPHFCCTGCQVVYQALHESGMDETYYRLQGVAVEREARPATTALDTLVLSELDSDAFAREHTRLLDDGTRTADLFLDGVHCAACVWLVERMPQALDGVVEARLDLPRARLTLQWTPGQVALSEVARWLARFGYTAHPVRRQESAQRTREEQKLLVRVGVAWALAGNVMLLAFALYAGLDLANDPAMATAARWMSLVLAVPSVVYGGSVFFRRAWASAGLAVRTRQLRSLHMDTPIALGVLVGTADSIRATVTGQGEVWFDSLTVLIAALLTARWLQLRSRRLAGDATERLLALIPTMARRIADYDVRDAEGEAELVPPPSAPPFEMVRVDEVRPGDLIEVPAGEVFPVDGVVVFGTSSVNNAVLTGESRPEPVKPGVRVAAGATNVSSPVRVRVEAAGAETRVGRLLAWVRDASSRRAPVVLLADRLSGYFVVTVVSVALAAAAFWLYREPSAAAAHVVALLVITCPCALGMATPLAMAVASGKAARAGIFIKSDEATQQLARLDAVVLDKTGTLTEGRMTLVDHAGDAQALDLAAALETQSNHPIAVALVQARGVCRLDGTQPGLPPVADFEAFAGHGICGTVDGHAVAAGRPEWIAARTGPLPDAFSARLAAWAGQGYTPVAVAVDGRAAAVLAVGDRLREEAKGLLAGLAAEGKTVYLLSGDHPDVVQCVARALGLPPERALGGVGPEAKQAFVEGLRARHAAVAMIGDGVNDAAALQAAHVGIAVHGGSTASLVAADVFLTRAGLAPVAELLAGTRRVMRVIRRNLATSLVYNVFGATAAVTGLVDPLVAAVAMPVSSLVVVASSILQRSFRPSGAAAGSSPARRPAPGAPAGGTGAAPPHPARLAA